jgi:hypothetical protein
MDFIAVIPFKAQGLCETEKKMKMGKKSCGSGEARSNFFDAASPRC